MDADCLFVGSRAVIRSAVAARMFGVLVAVPNASATSPGKDGRIVYMVEDGAGHWQIWVANSDLSGAKKLTHGHFDSGWAVWSPDGKRLVFDSNQTDHTLNDAFHVNDVFVMN